jgi:hypothetical protein
MSLFISSVFTYDEDAGNYIQAVEGPSGDNQALEPATRKAINNFVIGCKQDGIWTAIKASCILAGARTLAGALVPLVGTAPTNNGFIGIGTDYVRKTGLVGDASTKYLDSNRNNNADPQNSKHLAVWRSVPALNHNGYLLASGNSTGDSALYTGFGSFITYNNSNVSSSQALSAGAFYASSRSSSSSFDVRVNNASSTFTSASQSPRNANISVFSESTGTGDNSNARLAFYSIGESLDLALLDARVTDLINAFAVTIP